MKSTIEYTIISARSNPRTPAHENLMASVTSKLNEGYELLGAPLLGADVMYQAMTRALVEEPVVAAAA